MQLDPPYPLSAAPSERARLYFGTAVAGITRGLPPARRSIPILYLVVALYMWVSQWADRVNLLHRLAPPPATHDNQMQFVYKVLLPFAIALHVLMAVKVRASDIAAAPPRADCS